MHQWQWLISSTNDNDAELNRQFPLGTDLNEILPDLRTKTEKVDIEFFQHT